MQVFSTVSNTDKRKKEAGAAKFDSSTTQRSTIASGRPEPWFQTGREFRKSK